MIGNPLVSVVVPIYNVENYLTQCLDSIINQTYDNLEIILVDDGSTDSSGHIAEKYSEADVRVKVVHQINGGLSAARNTGINISHGSWIAFIDSDDYVNLDYISSLLTIAESQKADIATGHFMTFSNDGIRKNTTESYHTQTLNGPQSVNEMFANCRGMYIWRSIYNKSLFTKNNIEFPLGRIYEDMYVRYKLQYVAGNVAYTDRKLYNYRLRADSITTKSFSSKKFDDITKAIDEIIVFCAEHTQVDRHAVNNWIVTQVFILLSSMIVSDSYDPKLHKLMLKKYIDSGITLYKVSISHHIKLRLRLFMINYVAALKSYIKIRDIIR